MAKTHGVYLDLVGVADFPDDYEERLVDIALGEFSRLRLRSLAAEGSPR